MAKSESEIAEIENGAAQEIDATETLDTITELIKMVDTTDIVELNITSSDFKFTAKKKEALAPAAPPATYATAYPPPHAAAPPPPAAPPSGAAQAVSQAAKSAPPPEPAAPAVVDGLEIASPMSGTFYRAGAPGEAPYVRVGDKVSPGQTVGIIEAMKLMNEIEAEQGGTVVEICAENGSTVGPGETLFIIKPN